MKTGHANILVCEDEKAAGREAAERFACLAIRAVALRGAFYVAVPGGTSPRGMFEMLASHEFVDVIPWSRIEIFFTDERCVPPESEDSNFRLVHNLLLSSVPVPEQNMHRFCAEYPPEVAAEEYEKELREVMGHQPRFDLIVLGMGKDTHTASLFPGSPALDERERLAVSHYVKQLNTCRLTLTLPVLNNAENVMILAFGEEKSEPLTQVLLGETNIRLHPVQAIQPHNGHLLWIADQASASRL